ncbi:hypothetical protein GO298_02587 [Ralstonia solanacearum]|nr:hypothetical protein [Ralstonia solanacearum]
MDMQRNPKNSGKPFDISYGFPRNEAHPHPRIACPNKMETRTLPVNHLKRLRQALAPHGLKLLASEWQGMNAQYRFRCKSGHELSRSGSHLLYKLVECPTCRDVRRLEQLRDAARRAGGQCLAEQYAGRSARYHLICRDGHTFDKSGDKLLAGSWCPECAHRQQAKRMADPTGLKRLRAIVIERGGELLSTEYTKLADYYRFRCAEGHEWSTLGSEVVRGVWCRICANRRKVHAYRLQDGLEQLRRCAEDHDGICLASHYEGSKARYRFRCGEGHEWETLGARIFRGAWCPQCQYEAKRFGIDHMRNVAAERRGRCLSTVYRNATTKLEWECEHGHRWSAIPGAIVRGHWCPTCSQESLKLGIELMRSIATERGGQCVSGAYVDSATRLEWECARGHRWLATPNTIRRGHWCARCHFIDITTRPQTRRKRRHETVRV